MLPTTVELLRDSLREAECLSAQAAHKSATNPANESQRDSGSKPKVARVASPARTELPWVNGDKGFPNPNGVVAGLVAKLPQPRWG